MKILYTAALVILLPAYAPQAKPQATAQTTTELTAAGDAPADPGPRANLSPALTHKAIRTAIEKVVTWELKTRQPSFNRGWTYAALYDGLIAASAATGDQQGRDAVLQAAQTWNWQLDVSRFPHADDQALGQAYLDLYIQDPQPERIAATRRIMDRLVDSDMQPTAGALPDHPLWWWCDALFMAPPVLARLTHITGDAKYAEFMDRQWAITAALLYDPANHLYSRDRRYLDRTKMHEQNGQPIFWSRGNGWVVAALVNLLEYLPPNDPALQIYRRQFIDMLTRIAALQPPDGLWRAGLLDAAAYSNPEVSGSAFFTFAMAYGVRNNLLDRRIFLPVIRKAWAGMVHQIYATGRLGAIQPIGAAPDAFPPSSSYVYGAGAFLLAGAEIDGMQSGRMRKQ